MKLQDFPYLQRVWTALYLYWLASYGRLCSSQYSQNFGFAGLDV